MKSELITSLEKKLLSPRRDLNDLTAEEQFSVIRGKAAGGTSIVPEDGLLGLLRSSKQSGRPLRIKFGIDPTGPDIHIGHAISLLMLRRLQWMGHQVLFVIGDFTATIGDPGGRSDARAALSGEQVQQHQSTYEAQARKIISFEPAVFERHFNSTWLATLSLAKWLGMVKRVSVREILEREDFDKRLKSGAPISLAEFEYALLMGYDSVELKPDIEVGGVDQYLNFHMCRRMMELSGTQPEVFVTVNLLPGTSGESDDEGRFVKMSKSRNNYIPLEASPEDMFGKAMSIPDSVMWIWFREVTEISEQDLSLLKESVDNGATHPKAAKELLAKCVVAAFSDFDHTIVEGAARAFAEKFGPASVLVPNSTVSAEVAPDESLIVVLERITRRSRSDLRRLCEGEGIRILKGDSYVPIDLSTLLQNAESIVPCSMRVGKRDFFNLVFRVG